VSEPDFDWTLIRSFLAVMEAGSLLGASRRLHASQPTIGRHVAQLEAQLGCALFERTGRGLAPTRVAYRIAEDAQRMAEGAHGVARAIAGTRQNVSGSVRISASQTMAFVVLPEIIGRLRAANPQIQVELQATDTVANLLRREADIAVRMVMPEQGSLIARKLGTSKIGAYASRDYVLRRGQPVAPPELLQHDLIGLIDDDVILRGFAAGGIPATRESFAVRTDDPLVVWQLVRAGLGIGFLADKVAKRDPSLVQLIPEVGPTMPVWLVVHNEIRGNPAIKVVFDFLAAELERELAPVRVG
jgi:DNA-binding transcriptional LysR family regulator